MRGKPTLVSENKEADNLEGEADQDAGGDHKSGGKTSENDAVPRQMATRISPPVVTI